MVRTDILKSIILTGLILIFLPVSSQENSWPRDYKFGAFNQYDLRNSSENFISFHRVLNDGYRKGVMPMMGEKTGNFTYGLFSFANTFLSLIWSHEFGHVLRAKQAGGHFDIHNGSLPVPYTTMHLPDDVSLENEALAVTGGFEVNYLTVRSLQRQFISQDGIYNEDLGLSWAHRIMYPLYTFLIVPIDPNDPEVWKNTPGDPANIAVLVFRNYSNEQVFTSEDSSEVNPELVDYYNESVLSGLLFNLLDPQFYKETGGSFGSFKKNRKPIFLIGDHTTGWTYGTLFNTSPLGNEYYMNNYLHLSGNMFSFYGKYGTLFKNNGFGLGWQNFLQGKNLSLSAYLDVWDQDIYGSGVGGELDFTYRSSSNWGVFANVGYKTEGYVLGKQTSEGANLAIGITYRASYN